MKSTDYRGRVKPKVDFREALIYLHKAQQLLRLNGREADADTLAQIEDQLKDKRVESALL